MKLFVQLCLITILFTKTINIYAADKQTVFVSILPQQYFVQQVGNEFVDVHVMVGPGQNPATYEPTPQQMVALASADIYFSIGVPFELAWLDKVKRNNKKLKVIECCKSISNLAGEEHVHAHHHHEQDFDPHVWTSPIKVMHIVNLIEASLSESNASNTESYKQNAAIFIEQLTELDQSIKNKIAALDKRDLIVLHPSWSYFSDEYGFTQISIEQDGKEIQANAMVKLIKLAREKNIKAIFVQPQFNKKAAEVIADEIDATILEIDPLAFNYIEKIKDVTDKIVRCLSYE